VPQAVSINLDVLRDWMDSRHLERGELKDVRPLSGGTQNEMFMFERGARSFVFRGPPPHPRAESNKIMQREGTVLAALEGSEVPHPGFIAGCWEEEVIGRYFFLMEPIDGFNPGNGLNPPHSEDAALRNRMGYSYIEGMAKLGAVDYKSVGLEGFGKPDDFLERQAGRWIGQIERYNKFGDWRGYEDLGDFEAIARWLDNNIPAVYKPGIIHGDCHIANVMFEHDSGELAAMIDWEMSTIGDPLIDVGWMMATWPSDRHIQTFKIEPWDNFASVDELISHYGRFSERSLDAINWYGVLACFKLGAILEGTNARSSAGKAPKPIGDRLHNQTIKLFNKARRLMAGGKADS